MTVAGVGAVLARKGTNHSENEWEVEKKEEHKLQTRLIEKYKNGDLVFLNESEYDDFGFEIMALFLDGVSSAEEAKILFHSLSPEQKIELNNILRDGIKAETGMTPESDEDIAGLRKSILGSER
jgi:hypothetical protein